MQLRFVFILLFGLWANQVLSSNFDHPYKKNDLIRLDQSTLESINSLKRIISKTDYETIERIADSYKRINMYDSALSIYENLLSTYKNLGRKERIGPLYLKMMKVSTGMRYMERNFQYLDAYSQLIKSDPIDSESKLILNYHLSRKAFHQERFQEASDLINKCLERIDSFMEPYYKWATYTLAAYIGLQTTQDEPFVLDMLDKAKYIALTVNSKENNSIFNSYINLGNHYRLQKDYEEALFWFDKAEEAPLFEYKLKSLRVLYENKSKVYKALGSHEQSLNYLESVKLIDSLLREMHQNIGIHEINTKYSVAEKELQISALQTWKINYENNKWKFWSALISIFILSAYSFVRWKKADYHKRKLAKQKANLEIQHKQKIEQIKQLVIKDHIVLKNKAKITLDELIYIKSEDHYVRLQLLNDNAMVRGKLSDILNQLPPNFLRSHRSYIINQNLISHYLDNCVLMEGRYEIPVSRKYHADVFGSKDS